MASYGDLLAVDGSYSFTTTSPHSNHRGTSDLFASTWESPTSDMGRSITTRGTLSSATSYRGIIRDIRKYKHSDPEFYFLCFRRIIDLLTTPIKVVIDNEGVGEEVEPFFRKPFNWLSSNLNLWKKGMAVGLDPFIEWTVDALLETGMAGWEFRWDTVPVEGFGSVRLPVEGLVYSGHSLDLVKEGWDEEWEVFKEDSTEPFLRDGGRYQDLLRINWRPGQGYPYPFYSTLRDILRLRDDLLKEELNTIAAMNARERIWVVKMDMLKELDLSYSDLLKDDGSLYKKGITTIIKESVLQQYDSKHGYKEIILPNIVEIVEQQPDTTALLDKNKYNESRRKMFNAVGIIFDENGRLLEEESIRTLKGYLDGMRERVIEPALYRLCMEIVDRNRGLFTLRPKEFMQMRDQVNDLNTRLRSRKPSEAEARVRWKEERDKLMSRMETIPGSMVNPYYEFSPLTIDPVELKNVFFEMARMSMISYRTLQEMLGFSPEMERDRLKDEKEALMPRPDLLTQQNIYEPPIGLKQIAQDTNSISVNMRDRQGEYQDERGE